MPKSTNGKSNGGKSDLLDCIAVFTVPGEGETIAQTFKAAGSAIGVGHRTYTNVPMPVVLNEGEPLTRAQVLYISAQLARLALGSEDYETVNHAASVQRRAIPAQYTLLEDAADMVAQAYCEGAGITTAKRSDRDGLVAQLLAGKPGTKVKGLDKTAGEAIQAALVSLITATKAVKGKATAASAAAIGEASLFDE